MKIFPAKHLYLTHLRRFRVAGVLYLIFLLVWVPYSAYTSIADIRWTAEPLWNAASGLAYLFDSRTEPFTVAVAALVMTLLVFGYPTKGQKERVKPARAGLEYVVGTDRYPEMDEAFLKGMFSVRSGQTPYGEWMQAFCKRKYDSDFAREMTRSAELYLKDFREDQKSRTHAADLERKHEN